MPKLAVAKLPPSLGVSRYVLLLVNVCPCPTAWIGVRRNFLCYRRVCESVVFTHIFFMAST